MLVRRVWPSRPTFESSNVDFDQLRRQLFRLFDGMNNDTDGEVGPGVFPPINISHDNDNIFVRAEVPGMKATDLEISAVGRRLTISGRRQIPRESDGASYHRQERAEGEFNRTVSLPMEFDASRVDARYNAGILSVKLPKADTAKPRIVPVKG